MARASSRAMGSGQHGPATRNDDSRVRRHGPPRRRCRRPARDMPAGWVRYRATPAKPGRGKTLAPTRWYVEPALAVEAASDWSLA